MPSARAAATAVLLTLWTACAAPTWSGRAEPVSLADYKAAFAAAAGRQYDRALSFDDLVASLRGARVLWLGDLHQDQQLHQRQRRLLQQLEQHGFHLQLGLEAIATQDESVVAACLQGRSNLDELRRTILRRWRGSWLEDGDVDGDHYRRLLLLARQYGWPVRGLEPAPRFDLGARDAIIGRNVAAAAAAAPDRLLVVVVGQSHLLGKGDLVNRCGLPGVAIGAAPPPALAAAARPGGALPFLRSDTGLWFFADAAGGDVSRDWLGPDGGEPALPHDVERGDAIGLGQRREVEDLVDEHRHRAAEVTGDLRQVDELGRAFADDLRAEHLVTVAIGDQLQQTLGRAGDLAARQFVEA
jgi:hypothetical protein